MSFDQYLNLHLCSSDGLDAGFVATTKIFSETSAAYLWPEPVHLWETSLAKPRSDPVELCDVPALWPHEAELMAVAPLVVSLTYDEVDRPITPVGDSFPFDGLLPVTSDNEYLQESPLRPLSEYLKFVHEESDSFIHEEHGPQLLVKLTMALVRGRSFLRVMRQPFPRHCAHPENYFDFFVTTIPLRDMKKRSQYKQNKLENMVAAMSSGRPNIASIALAFGLEDYHLDLTRHLANKVMEMFADVCKFRLGQDCWNRQLTSAERNNHLELLLRFTSVWFPEIDKPGLEMIIKRGAYSEKQRVLRQMRRERHKQQSQVLGHPIFETSHQRRPRPDIRSDHTNYFEMIVQEMPESGER